ncbi:unnamed protein product [Angiostrongylus costaricensis]|uniref:FABP domain-containing protein n=1 Tax=Angiostrongylus costaricensis TaxID=334426 RepID=A0A0R3PPH8_ANGCS|nr:unnamed protein product [Angiostrongylus costaricensis]
MLLLSLFTLLCYAFKADAQLFLPRISFVEYFPSSLSFKPFSTGFPNLFPELPTFMTDFFKPGWGRDLEEKIKAAFKNALLVTDIESANGTTTITLSIGGKKFTRSFPTGTCYSLSSSKVEVDGKTNETVRITVNGTTSVYSTVDGKTTVTDDKGKPLADGGIFGVKGIAEITAAPFTEALRKIRKVMRS